MSQPFSVISQVEIILYVNDQPQSRDFYKHLLQLDPILDVPGMTEFQLTPELKLGLMPETGIAKILKGKTPHPDSGHGIPRCELYLIGKNAKAAYSRAIDSGAKAISPVQARDWGDRVGYVSDPDGHIIAFAQVIEN